MSSTDHDDRGDYEASGENRAELDVAGGPDFDPADPFPDTGIVDDCFAVPEVGAVEERDGAIKALLKP
jgi:hypothetical protein